MDDEISLDHAPSCIMAGRPPTRFFFNLNFRKKGRRRKTCRFIWIENDCQ